MRPRRLLASAGFVLALLGSWLVVGAAAAAPALGATSLPAAAMPASGEPGTGVPGAGAQAASVPGAGVLGTGLPVARVPGGAGVPGARMPASGEPGAELPVARVPGAAPAADPATPGQPDGQPHGPAGPTAPSGSVTIELDDLTGKPSTPVVMILGLTLISLAPAILLTCTSFTKILVVLGLTRNALGLQQSPPNQVLAGLALFLSLFVMSPVLGSVYDAGVQPYLEGTKTAAEAFEDGVKPLRTFMLDHTDDDELALLANVADQERPAKPAQVPLSTLVPAFVLTELKEAFIIGFIIFVPFLVIDMVVSGALMALGMMMMPPVMVSLPFKLLLFVMVNGWGLVVESLVASYR